MTAASQWLMEEARELRGFSVEWAEPGELIVARRNELFRTRRRGPPFESLGCVPMPRWKRVASRLRIAQRALRFMYYNVLKLPDDRMLCTFDRQIGIWHKGRYEPVAGLVPRARVLRNGCAIDARGDVYLGDYYLNRQRHEIHLYRLPASKNRLEVVHTFAAGDIRHVHGIYADPFDGSLWCVTGDRGEECRLLRSVDGFQTLHTIGSGDETWRCVSLLFTAEGAYYGSDAEFSQNYLYFVDRHTHQRKQISTVDGPVYYSTALGEDLFFGTAAEMCWDRRKGSLWQLRDQGPGRRVLSIDKDFFPVRFFQPGTWQFPRGPGDGTSLFVHLVGLRGDNRTYTLRRLAASDADVSSNASLASY